MAIALIAGCHDIDRAPGSSDDAVTGGAGFDSTGANLLVVGISRYDSFSVPTTLTDSKGNNGNYVGLTEYGQYNRALSRLYYCSNPTVGSNHTFTASGEFNKSIGAMAFSGAHATSPYDVANGNSDVSVGSLSLQPGNVTPSEDNCVVVTHLSAPNVTTSFSISGYTKQSHPREYASGIAYNVQTSATATNPTWTWTDDYAFCAATIAVFKAAAAGGGGAAISRNYYNLFVKRRRNLYRR